jgi:protein phosphatase
MRRRATGLTLALHLASLSAAAQDAAIRPSPEKVEQAREHYKRGLQLFGEHDNDAACWEFQRAYDLAPSYKLLYDLGLCREALGDHAGAVRNLEQYLASLGAEVPPERRAEVSTQLAALRQQVAFVTVTTTVPDADLLVDDAQVGKASADPLAVNPGRRRVWATKAGYYPASKELSLSSGDRVAVALELKEMPRAASPKEGRAGRIVRWGLPMATGVLATLVVIGLLRRRRVSAGGVLRVPRIDAYGGVARVDDPPCDPAPEHARRIVCDQDADIDEPPPPVRIALESGARTDIGKVKPTNQDSFLVREDKGLFVVADGIGGFAGGEIASATAVEVLARSFESGTIDVGRLTHLPRPGAELARAVYTANTEIRRKAAADWNVADMGTTCVAARFDLTKRRLYVAHIGDSRIYRLRGGALTQMTTDHTMESIGVVGGARAGHLAAALGADPCPRIDVLLARPRGGDVYLLCSDGLSKMVPDAQLMMTLSAPRSSDELAVELIALANASGGKDNVTAIVIRVTE